MIAFIDNDPAKHAIVRGLAGSPIAAAVVDAICETEILRKMLMYAERVPSVSNPADAPSRGLRPPELSEWPPPVCDTIFPVRSWAPQSGCELFTEGLFLGGLRDLPPSSA